MSYDWNSLDIKEKIMVVTTDILHLLDRLCEKTRRDGELDAAIETASKSFEPLGEFLQVNLEEEKDDDDQPLNLNALLQDISSGRSVIPPETARLLATSSFGLTANSLERSVGSKSLSTSSQSEQVSHNNKRRVEGLVSRDFTRPSVSVISKEVLSNNSHMKDLTQPGPSGILTQRKDAVISENFPKQSSRDLSQPGPSGMSCNVIREERHSSKSVTQPQHNRSTKSKVIEEKLPKRSSHDQLDLRYSKARRSKSDSKISSSVYESYTHYNPDDWQTDNNDEFEKNPTRSSTIY